MGDNTPLATHRNRREFEGAGVVGIASGDRQSTACQAFACRYEFPKNVWRDRKLLTLLSIGAMGGSEYPFLPL